MTIVWFLTIMFMPVGPGSIPHIDELNTAFETEKACHEEAHRLADLYKRPVGYECVPRKDFP